MVKCIQQDGGKHQVFQHERGCTCVVAAGLPRAAARAETARHNRRQRAAESGQLSGQRFFSSTANDDPPQTWRPDGASDE